MKRKFYLKKVLLALVAVGLLAGVVTWLIQPATPRWVAGPVTVRATHDSATVIWILDRGRASKSRDRFEVWRRVYSSLEAGRVYTAEYPGVPTRGQFKTSPAGSATFEFLVFGDTRTRHRVHRKVVEKMLQSSRPDFVIHTGDLVGDGRDADQWIKFFEIENPLLRQVVFYPVLGNHERNSPYFYRFFDLTQPYYCWRWGGAHFIALMSDVGHWAEDAAARQRLWTEQATWLERELTNHGAGTLSFVVMHHPPFTAVRRRQRETPIVQQLVPMFERYRVAAVFCGHDHNYQHHVVHGVHYIVTGGGGAPLYPTDAPVAGVTKFACSVENFVRVKVVGGQRAMVEAVALDGSVLERFEVP